MIKLTVDAATSRRLGKIRQKDTAPEVMVREMLTALGLKYRLNDRRLPGSPDIANRSARWAVFVHGCYWHHHPGCRRATIPKRNRAFWLAKFRANRARDLRACRDLAREGFSVLVVWECECGEPAALRRRLARLVGPQLQGRASVAPKTRPRRHRGRPQG